MNLSKLDSRYMGEIFSAHSLPFSFVSSRTQSSRRRTVKGNITFPYSDCLKSPRRRSATAQMKELRFGRIIGKQTPSGTTRAGLSSNRLNKTAPHGHETRNTMVKSTAQATDDDFPTVLHRPTESETFHRTLYATRSRSQLLLVTNAGLPDAETAYFRPFQA